MKVMPYSGQIPESIRGSVQGVEVLEVFPPVTIVDEDEFLTRLNDTIAAGTNPNVVLDLTRINLSEDVIAVLIHAAKALRQDRNVVFHLVPNDKGLRVIHTTRLDAYEAMGRVFATVNGAYAAFGTYQAPVEEEKK